MNKKNLAPCRVKRKLFLMILTLLLLAAAARAQNAGALIRARNAVVVSAEERASNIGLQVLQDGGNAVDAAVAVGFALAVTYPSAGNIGGGSYIIVRMADGREAAIDARETAPGGATREMYLDALGRAVPLASLRGPRASGVPGAVDGLLTALQRFGTMKREHLLAPAIRLARDGYLLKPHEAEFLERQLRYFSAFPSSMRVYARAGRAYNTGERFMQPDLAATLQRIAERGRAGFYEGITADLIARHMESGGGLITRADLKSYKAIFRKPLHGKYRGFHVLTMPPSSGGGAALLQLLNILEGYDLRAHGPASPETTHLLAEAMRHVYYDRWKYFGDPAFVRIPLDSLLDAGTAAAVRRSIRIDRAAESEFPAGAGAGKESDNTTHYCIVDSRGNAVSVTTTLNDVCGNKCVVDGAGFLLNDEMDDFSIAPGVLNQFGLPGSEKNSIEPGKRMLSSMSPTILLRDDRPRMIVGSPGGSRIITTVLQVIVNVVEHGMRVDSAIARGRVHHQWIPDTLYYERGALTDSALAVIARLGHRLKYTLPFGRVEAVVYDEKYKRWEAASDPRGHGMAVGY